MLQNLKCFRSGRIFAALALFFALGQQALAQGEAKRVRILLVIDSDTKGAADFGATHDRNNMRATLLRGLKKDGLKYTLDVLQGAKVSPQSVLDYYQNLKSGPDEALFFYYTGHGAMGPKKGQYLGMHRGNLFRSQLRTAMMNHKPRLAVILTDCCSTGVKADEPRPSEGPAPAKSPLPAPTKSGSVLRDLLFRHQGLVVIGAAKAGTMAAGDKSKGSDFTVAFCHLLNARPNQFDANKDGFVEWREIFPSLRKETQRISGKSSQTPQAFYLGQPFAK